LCKPEGYVKVNREFQYKTRNRNRQLVNYCGAEERGLNDGRSLDYNVLMFSALCQSKWLSADCFCIEPYGDAVWNASLAGRFLTNYEKLSLFTWKCKARRLLELHDSFSRCQICTKYYKIKSSV